ncbi:hypothetical protein VTI74DRAFT_410 [Chaetomium olivicolor]
MLASTARPAGNKPVGNLPLQPKSPQTRERNRDAGSESELSDSSSRLSRQRHGGMQKVGVLPRRNQQTSLSIIGLKEFLETTQPSHADTNTEEDLPFDTSRRYLSRPRDVSMPTGRLMGERPVARPASGRAASASILKKPSMELYYRHRQHEQDLTEARPLATTSAQQPASIHSNPQQPSFLQGPSPAFLQYSYEDWKERQRGGKDALPKSSSKSSGKALTGNDRPVTPTRDDEAALTSRWSPDTTPEESRLKKVKKALSFSRLRLRKSKANLSKSGSESNEPSAAASWRSSTTSSGSRRKSGNSDN